MSSNNGDIDPTPGLAKRDTWLDPVSTPQVIEEFMKNYRMVEKYMESLAKEARDLIVEAAETIFQEGLEVVVTHRAKTAKSLREKLKTRYEEKRYKVAQDIWDDIHDLAGVRIVLYWPSKDQRKKVRKIIRSIWGKDIKGKPGGTPSKVENFEDTDEDNDSDDPEKNKLKSTKKKRFKRRHLGYQAVHYRVDMKTIQKDYEKPRAPERTEYNQVEIQVVSALGHAWAEAGHNMLYKSYIYGEPTIQEERLLDALNGIIISSDSLLEEFHELVMKRTYTRWTHLNEFGIFLRGLDVLQEQEKQNKFGKEGLDVLFRFLTLTDQNYPLIVRNALKDMGYPDQPKLDTIWATYKPIFEPVNGTRASICLIHHLMQKGGSYVPKKIPTAGAMECCVMISALTLLQNCIGNPEDANDFLRNNFEMTEAQIASFDFVLVSSHRQAGLDESDPNFPIYEEDNVKPQIQAAWHWFRDQAGKSDSICGLFFRPAEMGATKMGANKHVDVMMLLTQLNIGKLSRTSSTSLEEETDNYGSEC
jgi:ppGpp synthetase/RelA/SpoT-type nucleotidyltranferase